MTIALDPLPIPENTRIEITIQPWALKALDGTELSDSVLGVWFSKFNPLYSHPMALETHAGKIVSKVPPSLLKLAIFETSKYMDAIINPCAGEEDPFFKQVRWRYATLRSILMIISQTHGVSSVTRKVLGDFEIEFDNSANDNNLISRILRDLAELEPIVISGGCLGMGTSYGPQGMVKGSLDPYRPIFGRTWWTPLEGEASAVRGKYSPGYRSGSRYPNRWRNATQRLTQKPRRGRS
jgi:hypothetical protein